ncbi:MAG TPA: ribosome maturation factor RimM [Acidobacteriaceae bacterium]|nr:ribosome maturation factor RimM [Acidobacteriaceae bacterium]
MVPDLQFRAERAGARPGSGPALVLVAKLIRPHGRRGEIVADILTDFPERFHGRSRLILIPPARIGTAPREVLMENFWFQRSRMVLKLQGIDSINEAESLRGYDVAIPAAERAPLPDGSAYVSDLIGCRVFDLNQGEVDVGEIVEVDRGSSNTDLLVVRAAGARGNQADAMIPFVREYLVHVDPGERRVVMRLPQGLLEINAPLTEDEKREVNPARETARRSRRARNHEGPRRA